jgi:hypothetical protein
MKRYFLVTTEDLRDGIVRADAAEVTDLTDHWDSQTKMAFDRLEANQWSLGMAQSPALAAAVAIEDALS